MDNKMKTAVIAMAYMRAINNIDEVYAYAEQQLKEYDQRNNIKRSPLEFKLEAFTAFNNASAEGILKLLESKKLIVISPASRKDAIASLATLDITIAAFGKYIKDITEEAQKEIEEGKHE